MSSVSAEKIKELRERTGVGMSKCKEALQETHGDIEKAIDYLRKLGVASAVKKAERETKEGLIGFYEGKDAIALIEINTETDFVAQNEKFKEFLREVVKAAAEHKISDPEALLSIKLHHGETVDQYRSSLMQSLGENIKIKRLSIFPKSSKSSFGLYSHMGGKLVCVVELEGNSQQESIARDIAMHVAAESPEFMSKEEIPESLLEREREIARTHMQGKPAAMIDKILEGKIKTFYEQVVLPLQKFVKDNSISVGEYVENQAKKLGHPLVIKRYVRWKVGD